MNGMTYLHDIVDYGGFAHYLYLVKGSKEGCEEILSCPECGHNSTVRKKGNVYICSCTNCNFGGYRDFEKWVAIKKYNIAVRMANQLHEQWKNTGKKYWKMAKRDNTWNDRQNVLENG